MRNYLDPYVHIAKHRMINVTLFSIELNTFYLAILPMYYPESLNLITVFGSFIIETDPVIQLLAGKKHICANLIKKMVVFVAAGRF